MLNLETSVHTKVLTEAEKVASQVRSEFPWFPKALLEAIEHIAEGKVVVPSLELDQQIHALCLLTRVSNRVNSIMFEHTGHVCEHRPACTWTPGEIDSIRVQPLTSDENAEHEAMFSPLLAEMSRLEGENSMVNIRSVAPGIYTLAEYKTHPRGGPVVLQ